MKKTKCSNIAIATAMAYCADMTATAAADTADPNAGNGMSSSCANNTGGALA